MCSSIPGPFQHPVASFLKRSGYLVLVPFLLLFVEEEGLDLDAAQLERQEDGVVLLRMQDEEGRNALSRPLSRPCVKGCGW